jgi:asparagine synthase (glutamine-hydrolysing)
MDRFATQRPAIRAMRTDMHSYLPCDILAKVDVTSMAHGLECRSPFMDHVLVEAVSRFPVDAIYKKRLVKPLLGRTFESLIPPDLMHRRKVGFNLPLTSWLNPRFEAMVSDLLRSPNARCGNYVRSDVMDRMIREHASGYQNHGDRLWSLVVLESWLKHASQRASRSSRKNPSSGDRAVATSLIN